jgi:hypothetical protein
MYVCTEYMHIGEVIKKLQISVHSAVNMLVLMVELNDKLHAAF